LADTVFPEAFEHGGRWVALATAIGFACAFLLNELTRIDLTAGRRPWFGLPGCPELVGDCYAEPLGCSPVGGLHGSMGGAAGACHSSCHSTWRYSARQERTGWMIHPT
jgi:hypothetical protein